MTETFRHENQVAFRLHAFQRLHVIKQMGVNLVNPILNTPRSMNSTRRILTDWVHPPSLFAMNQVLKSSCVPVETYTAARTADHHDRFRRFWSECTGIPPANQLWYCDLHSRPTHKHGIPIKDIRRLIHLILNLQSLSHSLFDEFTTKHLTRALALVHDYVPRISNTAWAILEIFCQPFPFKCRLSANKSGAICKLQPAEQERSGWLCQGPSAGVASIHHRDVTKLRDSLSAMPVGWGVFCGKTPPTAA
mmetsp:Transcript_31769/g.69499  ORF Transcript_31769/g.69499 Transcript_31769/m.69499 type:complete len:249 (+) Transcript_31769:675-1421(+)